MELVFGNTDGRTDERTADGRTDRRGSQNSYLDFLILQLSLDTLTHDLLDRGICFKCFIITTIQKVSKKCPESILRVS